MRLSRQLTALALGAILALALISCKGGAADENRSPGESVYRSRCQTCHALPKPVKMSDADWPGFIHDHAERAKLSAEQIDQVLTYLISSN
ncbi:MAG: cytochrome c [candidate division Zixibacteria bacterium]|nr:cytochrome c [candidate division Zixibacteria bacterium]